MFLFYPAINAGKNPSPRQIQRNAVSYANAGEETVGTKLSRHIRKNTGRVLYCTPIFVCLLCVVSLIRRVGAWIRVRLNL